MKPEKSNLNYDATGSVEHQVAGQNCPVPTSLIHPPFVPNAEELARWLDLELESLVKRYANFATAGSNRRFFSR